MKKITKQFYALFFCFLLIAGFFGIFHEVSAQVNPAINFTGKVTESDGSELPDGVYDFSFSLFNVPSGGSALWSEDLNAGNRFVAQVSGGVAGAFSTTYSYSADVSEATLRVGQYLSNTSTGEAVLVTDFDTVANTITVLGAEVWPDGTSVNNRPFVEGGVIDVSLGTVSALSGIDFNQTLYLEITFNGETMRPRKVIDSVVSAFNSDTLDGFHSSDFANLADNATVNGEWTFNNIVEISTSSNLTALTVAQNGSGGLVDFKIGTTTAFAVLGDGRVQIGDYYFPSSHGLPGYVLKTNINGDLYWDVDYAGSGGGAGMWATTTDNLLVFQSDVSQKLVLGNIATTAPLSAQFEVQGLSWFDTVAVSNSQSLRLYDADSSNYMSIRATGTLSTDFILTLPGSYGTIGQALITDGNGNLTWGSPSGTGLVNAATLAGQIPFYNSASNILTATSAIFISPINSHVGIGTTTPNSLFSVNGTGEFNELCFGGSCISGWGEAGSVDGSGVSGQIAIWSSANGLSSEAYLASSRGGLGQDFSGATGFLYFNAGSASASSTISIGMTDLDAGTGLVLAGNTLRIDANGDWTGTLDGQDGAYYLNAVNLNNFTIPFASALAGTTTNALAEGANNLYWTNARFDTRLSATTSLPNVTALNGLQSVGTITSGTWNANILDVDFGGTGQDSSGWTGIAYVNSGVWEASSTLSANIGGTGFSSYTAGDLLYANSLGGLSKLPAGSTSDILVISGSGLPSWVATTSLGLDIQNMTGILDPAHGGTGQDFSAATGYIYLDGGIASASSTIAIAHTDLAVSTGLTLNSNILGLNTAGNWTGTFDGLEGSNIFTLSDWFATSSAPQLTALVNLSSVGNITSGTWQASVIDVAHGGTNRNTWTQYAIPYMTSASSFGEVAIGSSTYVFAVNASGDGYEWIPASSTGTILTQEEVDDYIDALINDADSIHSRITITYDDASNAMDFEVNPDLALYSNVNTKYFSTSTDVLGTVSGGTGINSSAWTGFSYVDAGVWSASNTVSASRLDALVMLSGEDISLLNNNLGFVNVSGARSALSATSPLTYNSTSGEFAINMASSSANGYLSSVDWTTFNNKQNPLSFGNITESSSNVLTITGGTGAVIGSGVSIEVDTDLANYDNSNTNFVSLSGLDATSPIIYDSGTGMFSLGVVPVSYGGTGTSTFEANSMLYARADNAIGEVLAGANGAVLKMIGGVPTWGVDLNGEGNYSPWATSSDSLMIHPNPDTEIVLIGASATSAVGYIFEVVGNSLFGGSISAQDLSLVNALNVSSGGTGTSTPSGLLYGDGAGNIVSVNNNSANWNTAYSWGDHSAGNYFSTTTDTLNVAYGGTGRTTWVANSLVYSDTTNSLNQILPGSEGQALIMNGGVPTWSSTSPGVAHGLLSALHSGTEATSTQVRGDMLTVNAAGTYTRLALGPSGYILRSDGLDATWVPTVNITELGTITAGEWNGDVIGLAYGGTGTSTAEGVREVLDLDEIYANAINSTATSGWLWMSDGNGRGSWVPSTTLMAILTTGDSKFVGTTTANYDGLFTSNSMQGYQAANDICAAEFSGSHFCRVYDILVSVEQDDISSWGASAWVAEGPPGYTSNSNDCQGWTSENSAHMGAFWAFDSDGGGMGWLTNCAVFKPIACCGR